MSAYIKKLTIQNYKSCGNLILDLERYTPLIGYNNSGKSNIISSIQWALKKTSLPESSFKNKQLEVSVELEINGIDQNLLQLIEEDHRNRISPYIENNSIIIKRLQNLPNASAKDIKLLIWHPNKKSWDSNPTGIDNAISKLFPEPIRIGAMENAAEDSAKSKTTTTIGKLLAEFIKPIRDAHEFAINQHLNPIEQQLSFNGTNRLSEFNQIDNSINSKINDLFPGIGLKLHFPVPTIDDLIRDGTVKVHEHGSPSMDFSSYGHGTQRAIQMALVRHLAEVKRGQAGVGTTLLLIDEPELYLHPFAIEHVREALKILSNSGYQVVFSTHSAQMVKSEDAQNSILIRKSPTLGTYARNRLQTAIQAAVPNSIHQMEQLFTLSHSSQILFADKIILTEGKTELRLLPFIFEKSTTKTLGQKQIALVPQSGVNDTKKSMEILKNMDLPCKAIVDLDYAFGGAVTHGFLSSTDNDLVALKQIISMLASQGKITINANGLPQKGTVSASKAFEILASEASAIPYIDNLHQKLKSKNIWLWKNGAIEVPLGLNSKDENDWAQFQFNVSKNGFQATCPGHQIITEMTNWIDS